MFYKPEQIELKQPIILYGSDALGYKVYEFNGIGAAIDFLKTADDIDTSATRKLIVRIRLTLKGTETPVKRIEVKGEKDHVISELEKHEQQMKSLQLIS